MAYNSDSDDDVSETLLQATFHPQQKRCSMVWLDHVTRDPPVLDVGDVTSYFRDLAVTSRSSPTTDEKDHGDAGGDEGGGFCDAATSEKSSLMTSHTHPRRFSLARCSSDGKRRNTIYGYESRGNE